MTTHFPLLALLTAATLAPVSCGTAVTVERLALVMGTTLKITVTAGDRTIALAASDASLTAVNTVEDRLSTWRSESQLSHFNLGGPQWQEITPSLEKDLRRGLELTRRSGGTFHLAMGDLVRLWDLRGAGRLPSPSELVSAIPPFPEMTLEIQDGRARRGGSPALEEGGFAKGIALEEASSAAIEAGANCVELDLGGQLMVVGSCQSHTIDIAHPHHRQMAVASLQLLASSAATSGGSQRSLVVNAQPINHIIDPRTGQPAGFTGSATVISDDPVEADALATALVVMGWDAARAWLAQNVDVEAVLALAEGDEVTLAATPRVVSLLRRLEKNVAVEVINRGSPDLSSSTSPVQQSVISSSGVS